MTKLIVAFRSVANAPIERNDVTGLVKLLDYGGMCFEKLKLVLRFGMKKTTIQRLEDL